MALNGYSMHLTPPIDLNWLSMNLEMHHMDMDIFQLGMNKSPDLL